MKNIKVDNVTDKFVSYYLYKNQIPFNFLKLKKMRGRENYQLTHGEIKQQIGKFFILKIWTFWSSC